VVHGINWSAPWLAPYQALGQKIEGSVLQGGLSVHEALNRAQHEQGHPTPVRFVPQSDLPSGVAYEQFIFDTGCVPTRDGAHDFFNGLCWLLFPKLKQRLNHLQAQALAVQPRTLTRGPVRDALTLVDENAAWLRAPQVLWAALLAKDWGRVWELWHQNQAEVGLWLFGHALLEKLELPRKPITAHVIWMPPEAPMSWRAAGPTSPEDFAASDNWGAQVLSADWLATKPFAHLPVLGVPSWWPANTDPSFYNDPEVFRPPRANAGP